MAERVETEMEMVEQVNKTTYYECDKCHGRNHEETTWEDDLNKVVFGAEIASTLSMSSNFRGREPDIYGKYEYLLCDQCMERAHSYLEDFY